MHLPELLSPAGTFEKMTYAFAYGADAVYAGIPRFSLRARENDFTEQKLEQAVRFAHKLGKKIYLTMNIFPHNRKVDSFKEMLSRVARLDMDGLIMADPGMIGFTRDRYPDIPIHLSTQANTINYESVRFWQKAGVRRIILSRELSIEEIAEIKQRIPEMELETFIHGAICIAYSGRCLLSNYFNHRDANQGTCTNACRWEYNVYKMEDSGDTVLPGHYMIEETERPGSLMPVDEDEHGTYIMNAKDLSTIGILNRLMDTGIDSLKIEGRTKSVYYLSVVTRAYRSAMDMLAAGRPVPRELQEEVYAVANRGYVTGFLERNPLDNGQNYEQGHSDNQSRLFVGIVEGWDEGTGQATIRVRNRLEEGDRLEMITPEKTVSFLAANMHDLDGTPVQTAHGGGKNIRLELPQAPGDYALLRKVVAETVEVE
ncbi:MAG TPA: U32 family peptidase [Caldithrix abyssi]|uniref:U32 family peptidase n=1 Tax=Caldithrix abyssi TaxID=187145 RepID=A0A7V4TY98_CALAY|nr:U32 family peptidase [Caldithrix abyssi]